MPIRNLRFSWLGVEGFGTLVAFHRFRDNLTTRYRTSRSTVSRWNCMTSIHMLVQQVGHLVIDALEPLFYTMFDIAGRDLSNWDTNVILGESRPSFCHVQTGSLRLRIYCRAQRHCYFHGFHADSAIFPELGEHAGSLKRQQHNRSLISFGKHHCRAQSRGNHSEYQLTPAPQPCYPCHARVFIPYQYSQGPKRSISIAVEAATDLL